MELAIVLGSILLTAALLRNRPPENMDPKLYPFGFSSEPNGIDRVLAMRTTGEDPRPHGKFVVDLLGLDRSKALIIEGVDVSTSMRAAAQVFPGAQRDFAERMLRDLGSRATLVQFWCATRPRMVGPPGIRDRPLADYRCLTTEEMVKRGEDSLGILEPGSAISDWIRVLGEIALAAKAAGVPAVTLVLHTDGENQVSFGGEKWRPLSERLARDTVRRMQRAGVAIRLIGVTPKTKEQGLRAFFRRVGTSEMKADGSGEATVFAYTSGKPDSLHRAWTAWATETSASVVGTMCGFPGRREPRNQSC